MFMFKGVDLVLCQSLSFEDLELVCFTECLPLLSHSPSLRTVIIMFLSRLCSLSLSVFNPVHRKVWDKNEWKCTTIKADTDCDSVLTSSGEGEHHRGGD